MTARGRAPSLVVAGTVAAVLAACTATAEEPSVDVTATARPAPSATTPAPTAPDPAAPDTVVSGRYPPRLGSEISGIAAGVAVDGLWLVDDEPGTDRVHLVGLDGARRATVVLADTSLVNAEDLAVGPCPDDAATSCVHVADIGDNVAGRDEVAVLAFPEDRSRDAAPGGRRTVTVAPAVRRLRYADGPVDAEALVVDRDGAIVVVDKRPDVAGVHVAASGADVLERVATLPLPEPADPFLGAVVGHTVTAADLARDGETLLLRTYDQLVLLTAPDGEPLTAASAAGLPSWPVRDLGPVPTELQGEAATILDDGRIVTVAEGSTAISVTVPG